MATAALVDRYIDIGRRIVTALTDANIKVTACLWAFVPEAEEWRFIVATPLVDTKGPLAAYRAVNTALQRKKEVLDDLPPSGIFLKSPNDRALKALQKESRAVPHDTFRVVNGSIEGTYIEDAYVYTGWIDVLEVSPGKYRVIYAPYSGPGGAVPSLKFESLESVREFLVSKLHIHPFVVEAALKELPVKGGTSIPNVQPRTHDLRRLGLA